MQPPIIPDVVEHGLRQRVHAVDQLAHRVFRVELRLQPDALHLLCAPLVRVDGGDEAELSVHVLAVEHATANHLAHQTNVMGSIDLVKEAPHLFPGLARHLLALGHKLGDLLLANASMHVEHAEVLLVLVVDEPHHVCEKLYQARLAAPCLAADDNGYAATQPDGHKHHLEKIVGSQSVSAPLVARSQLLNQRGVVHGQKEQQLLEKLLLIECTIVWRLN